MTSTNKHTVNFKTRFCYAPSIAFPDFIGCNPKMYVGYGDDLNTVTKSGSVSLNTQIMTKNE